ncbi:nuclear transport factor 2 family protein [Williamsia sp. SKLECPSW1]
MSLIEKYYATIDEGRLDDAVTMLAPDVEFAMILPGGENRGRGRDRMFEYLSGRPPVGRRHVLRRVADDRDVEFAQGMVTEAGPDGDAVTTGHFVGVMHIGDAGLVDRYQVSFSADFAVLPSDGVAL